MKDNALIVFLRKPEAGKVKTRLAKEIGDQNALKVYTQLVEKTIGEIKNLKAEIYLFFTPELPENNEWNDFNLRIQKGNDLGECMKNAFEELLAKGHQHVIIIGSDCFQITSELLTEAFLGLKENEYVIGPSEDGGYYLIGMNNLNEEIFNDMEWSTSSVYACTLGKLSGHPYAELPVLNDIDTLDDLKKEPELLKLVN